MRRLFASLLFTAAMLGAAQAADCYPNVAGTQANCGEVQMWNNGSGQSQPTTAAAPLPTVQTGALPAGSAIIGKVGIDQTTPGTTNAVSTEGTKTTYSASFNLSSFATSATDVFTITGSASKTIRVTRLASSGIATAAASFPINALKRSTADTSGTFVSISAVPHDSSNVAATASVGVYTANPTVGNSVGSLRFDYLPLGTTTAQSGPPIIWDFTTRNGQAVVLRGTSQVLAVNFNGGTVPSGSQITFSVEWTEE